MTYSNLFRLTKENGGKGRIYDFYRGEQWNPNFIFSDDDGETWSYGGKLIAHEGRPYVKYAGNGVNEIHFVFGEGHPNEYAPGTGIYHAYYRGGNLYRSDGTMIAALGDGPIAPRQATQVFAGDPADIAWACDLHLDSRGRPFLAYSVSKDRQGNDHRYRYARWDGQRWQDHEIAYAGSRLYAGEVHYMGNASLDPQNPDELYISTNADPTSGQPLLGNADGKRHWEIFRGLTHDGGATWIWSPVTANSTVQQLAAARAHQRSATRRPALAARQLHDLPRLEPGGSGPADRAVTGAGSRDQLFIGLADLPQIAGQAVLQIDQVLPLTLFERHAFALALGPDRLNQAAHAETQILKHLGQLGRLAGTERFGQLGAVSV